MSDKIEKEENAETVALTPAVTVTEKPKKQKRKFTWTEARRKAFAKCVEARKKGLQKEKKPKKIKKENSSSESSNSDSDNDNDNDNSDDDELQKVTSKSKQKDKAPSKWRKVHKELQYIRQKLSENIPQNRKQKQNQKVIERKRDLSDDDSFSEEEEHSAPIRKQLPPIQRNTSHVVPAISKTPKYHFM